VSLHKLAEYNNTLETTVAYQVRYYPWSKLSSAATRATVWQKSSVMSKKELLEDVNEDKTHVIFTDDSWFGINWEYNNIPTEEQWNQLPNSTLIRVQFRISPLAGGTGRIAILTLVSKIIDNPEHSEIRNYS
jgi:hypothetical protein